MLFGALLIAAVLFVSAGCSKPDSEARKDSTSADTLRLLAYNIHHGEGMDEVLDLERIAALIRTVNPDIVTLQEIDSVAGRTDGVDQAVELGRLTGLTPVFGRFMSYDGGAYGMALLSRWPIVSTQNIRLPDGEEPRSALSAVISSPDSDRQIRVIGIHFYRTEEERMAQALSLEEQLGNDELPTVLAGDFNSTPDSPVIAHLSQGWQIVNKGDDRLTFSSFDPYEEIDFVMYRPENTFMVSGQRMMDEPVASDHRPMFVELVVK